MEAILKPYKDKIKEMEKKDQEKVFYGAQSPVRTIPRRQIEYEAGEEMTENHRKQVETLIRVMRAALEANAAGVDDLKDRLFDVLIPYIPVARIEQLFSQVAIIEHPPQQGQVPARIEQVLQPVLQAPQPQ